MSVTRTSSYSSASTYDEYAERTLQNPEVPRRPHRQYRSQPQRSGAQSHPQIQDKDENDVSFEMTTAMEVITMEHAVCVPHALRSATRRTMLDVLGHIRTLSQRLGQRTSREGSVKSCNGAEPTENALPPKDLSRSLRHHLQPRHADTVNHRTLQQLAPDDLIISDFDEDDEEEEYSRKGNEGIRKDEPMSSVDYPVSCSGGEVKLSSANRVWAKLFDMHGDDVVEEESKSNPIHPDYSVRCEAEAGTSDNREITTKEGNREEEAEEFLRSSTATGRRTMQSIATLLDAAEAQDAEEHKRTSADGNELFTATDKQSSAFVAAMTGGRGTQRASAAMRQLAANPTSARVIAYLTKSKEEWQFDVGSLTEEALEAEIGVHVKLRVKKVDSAFSLYCVQCELVWTEPSARQDMYPTCVHTSDDTTTSAMVNEGVEKENGEGIRRTPGIASTGEDNAWTVVLSAAIFRSTPIIVGEHIYLARPFFCYPSVRTIVASLNITCDTAIRRLREEYNERLQRRQRQKRTTEDMYAHCDEASVGGTDLLTLPSAQPLQRIRAEDTAQKEEHEHTPFKAYDPFVNPPAHLFRPNPTRSSLSITPLRGAQRESLQSTPRKTMMDADRHPLPVSSDVIGAHFPRGPGEEWDVPLEVLLAICPPQFNDAAGGREAAVHRGREEENLMDSGESFCTSLSSVEYGKDNRGVESSLDVVGTTRTDKVLFGD